MRGSRIPKAEQIPVECSLSLVRDWIANRTSFCKTTAPLIELLKSAAPRNEEARWLLSVFQSVPENAKELKIALSLAENATGWSQYYRALLLNGAAPETQVSLVLLPLLRESAELGFVPAMTKYGSLLSIYGNLETALTWLNKAAKGGDLEALLEQNGHFGSHADQILANPQKSFYAYFIAARHGNFVAMSELISNSAISNLERAIWKARLILFRLFPHCEVTIDEIRSFLLYRLPMNSYRPSLHCIYVVGRELEGYEQLWEQANHHELKNSPYERCIGIYLVISNRARVAALQTLVAMLKCGIHRDIARLIAQRVYATREHFAFDWYEN